MNNNYSFHYSAERNVQVVLSLFKTYGIKQVIASPGAINIPVVASMQQDPYFEMVSCVDERSAAYMACGWAEESGKPVVLSCTGATSSRNYMPGLTEAFYRKLPVIALTSSRDASWICHLFPQVTDRRAHPNDIIVDFVHVPTIKDNNDDWDVTLKLNRALNNINKGPIHINITDAVNHEYNVLKLPTVNVIKRITISDEFPLIPKDGKIAIFCGEHKVWSKDETVAIDNFCSTHDAVVFVDHTSKYFGKYRILYSIVGAQDNYQSSIPDFDLIIHIGEVSGAYDVFGPLSSKAKNCWRVNPDGEFRDFFRKLRFVFQMSEIDFFNHYSDTNKSNHSLFDLIYSEYNKVQQSIPELPFSNIYLGRRIGEHLPDNSILYLGILNSLRTWSFSEINSTVKVYSNTGGFGIDGTLSSAIGSSFVNPQRLSFVVLGDLSFFYDMNSIGNHVIKSNIRILLVNNGKGIEFRHYNHQASFLGDKADSYVAAAGHWGNKSQNLVKHYAEDLGFSYLAASNKEELEKALIPFLDPNINDKPVLLEVFTETEAEIESLKVIHNALNNIPFHQNLKKEIKKTAKKIIGEKGNKIIKILRS